MEGRKGLQHHWKPYELFRRSPGIVLCLFCDVWSHGCPNKSATKEGHRWSQCYLPKQSKKADFCWARCCWPATCASWKTGCLDEGTAQFRSSIHHRTDQQPSSRRRRHSHVWPQWAAQVVTSSCRLCLSGHQRCLWPPKLPLQWTPDLLKAIRGAQCADVLQNANDIPTGSIPMTQKARPPGATPLPCIHGYRATALMTCPKSCKLPGAFFFVFLLANWNFTFTSQSSTLCSARDGREVGCAGGMRGAAIFVSADDGQACFACG